MKSENLFTKVVALLLCAMLVIGYLPVAPIAVSAADDDWESDMDVVETEPPLGSEANPIQLTSLENTVTVAAGETVYYYIYNVGGMIMTVSGSTGFGVVVGDVTTADAEGVVSLTAVAAPRTAYNFAVVNNTEADADYSIVFTYPEGSLENPLVASLGENVASVEAGDTDGYYMIYTADYTGTLQVEISAEAGWSYVINNLTTYAYGANQSSDSDPVVNPAEIAVTAGDEIQIIVNTYNPEDQWNTPAGDITVNLSYKLGSCPEAAIFLGKMENSVTNAGTVYYMGYFSGTTMTVAGEGEFSVTYNGETIAAVDGVVSIPVSSANPRMPVEFSVTGDGDYTINFAYPVGSANNPLVATLGDNTASVEAGNTQGFLMTYTADYTGVLLVELSGVDGWTYTINNMTTYKYGDTQWSDSDPVVNPAEIAVNAGDEIQITVNTYDAADMWNTPAGEINVNLSYKLGSCPEAAIFLGNMENSVTNAGTVYYMGYFSGTIMTVAGEGDFSVTYNGETIAAVDGVVSIPVSSPNPRMPVEFSVTGDGNYTINFAYPAGSQSNPAVAVLGDNVASIEAGSQGYYFTYTAEKAGDLIVTISGADGWTYTINNLTTGSYGDTQWSDSDPVVNPATVTVAAGDEIQIIVNTYDAADMWNVPAGDITVNLAYKEVVLPSGYAELKFSGATLKLEADLTMNVLVRTNVFADGNYTNGRVEISMTDAKTGVVNTVVYTDNYTVSGGFRTYVFTGISPRKMNDTITLTVYGTYAGTEYSKTMEYSVATYAYNKLKTSTDTKFLTLLADLLNFGAAHQTYTGYNTEKLVNANMTETQKGYASTGTQTLTNKLNAKYEVIDNPSASFRGASLVLSEKVEIQYIVAVSDLTDVTLRVTADGTTYIIDSSEFVSSANGYQVNVSSLQAKQMRSDVTATVYRGETPISNTALYSVESYAATKISGNDANLVALLKMMMYYGDSAAAYFA